MASRNTPDDDGNNHPHNVQPDCKAILALIPAYSIGATDPDETRFVKANLANCPEGIAELQKYQRLSSALQESIPVVKAPALLEGQLLAKARQSGAASKLTGSSVPRTVNRTRFLRRLAVAALLIISMGLNGYLLSELLRVRNEQTQLATTLATQQEILRIINADGFQKMSLAVHQTGGDQSPSATIVWDTAHETAVLYVQNFPALSSAQAYQLWLSQGADLQSGGLFQVDANGTGTLLFKPPARIDALKFVGITPEPAAGSDAPTAPPVASYQS